MLLCIKTQQSRLAFAFHLVCFREVEMRIRDKHLYVNEEEILI